ncbi:adenosylcobinamide-phosphate synthase CbiB [Microbaculum marinum]|uniref:Cobalamin biosynthesis protein CobD n=1 Tax=Microbaculum marinum TaxID=1764581 RepID=A0AAW9RPL9_9HYPH
MSLLSNLSIVLAALLIEAAIGYPAPVQRAVRHPVVWIGALIDRLDVRFNRASLPESRRRLNGVGALCVLLAAAVVPALIVQASLFAVLPWAAAALLSGIAASSLIAQRSLWRHVAAVAEGLETEGLAGGRKAVAHIVGRNPDSLDEAGVARAAIESLAENFSDGIVAPALWCAVAGLPGIAAYKAVNTADSMIGHRTERHRAFGWAAARFDDLVNLPASRLSAVWITLAALVAGEDAAGAWRAARRDARRHRSPNAGWPEAAIAGALGLRLAGPRIYGPTRVDDAWMGDGRAEATAADIRRALRVYRAACGVQIGALALVAGVVMVAVRGVL